ncbi:DNA recombination protein RmuC [Gramella sp. Hel_I_59]|uniref:DNA recombination protein RmuC n=1 Tax=Gramella sp. Hel_I_59 TaxID=1249978 RepID=UPI0011544D0C|nr:DNA recombination protein RmuC [Gramella sp. Hel_I_59]TQI70969.1 DNA recombination protein RmuC [Gramella sp. Hel_I_59]
MTEPVYLIFLFLFIFALGFALAYFLKGTKSKEVLKNADYQIDKLKLQIESDKKLYTSQLEDNKINILQLKNENIEVLQKKEEQLETLRNERGKIQILLTQKEAENEHLLERSKTLNLEIEKLHAKFNEQFENLANRIFEQKSEKFTDLNQKNISAILNPLDKKLKEFEDKINDSNLASVKRHAELGEKLRFLNEQNIKISEEANNLTKALKGNTKMQGNWGEMILERVLEKSGLTKGNEYDVQQSLTTQEGKRVIPDVVINLPGDKKMIVDSKVSLNAYERYVNAEDLTEQSAHLKDHLLALKQRVQELSKKNYQMLHQEASPDFVLLFIPIEAAFAVASNENPNLYNEAFEQNIILVTPTTLLAVLRTIESMWQNEKQKQNAIEIANQAGALYDSFTNLTIELEKVGRQIGTVQNSYDGAMKKLTGKGNLIRKVERLKKLGAKASKQIDPKLIRGSNSETLNEN